jgi:hypothetical protein
MTEKTDLNVSPYFDDYSEDKNFQKVLFRAGRSLQSRELTQSQSILQNQIERMGDHFFKEGSIVQGAQTGIDMELYYVKVQSANPNAGGDANAADYRTAFHGKYLQGKTTGVVGKVITSSAETSDDALTIFVKYARQGTDAGNSFTFSALEELQEVTLSATGAVEIVSSNLNEFTVKAQTEVDNPNGFASIANISEGIVFVRGFFVKVPAQELILEKYSSSPSYRIGLTISETLVSSATDTSLLDNSTGTSNENAPGADRLKFSMVLSKYTIATTTDTDFVELARVNQGVIELTINRPAYGQIENSMARRTFDANGDFVITQFTHSLREHLDDTTNRGFYSVQNGGDETKIIMQVSPGKGYVKGYEIDKIGTTTIPFSKARTTTSLDNANTPIRIGNKLRVKNAHSLPEFGSEAGDDTMSPFKECELFDSSIPVTSPVGGTKPTSGQIGIARVRNIDLYSGSDSSDVYSDDSIWNLYMFDIKMFTKLTGTLANTFIAGDRVTGSVSGATAIVHHTESSNLFVHDVQGAFVAADNLSVAGNGSTATLTSTNTAPRTYNIDRARSITQTPKNNQREIFTADLVLDSDKVLTGSVTISNANPAVLTGFGTNFADELKEGDIIIDGAGDEKIVASVTNGTSATLTTTATVLTNSNVIRRRATLKDQDQTVAIASWPRDWIDSHTGESVQVRRQEVVTVSSGSITVTTGSNGIFAAKNTDNFTIAVIEKSSDASAYAQGALLNVEDFSGSAVSSGSGQSLTLSGISNNEDAVLKVTYTVTITDPINRDKTLRSARVLKVGSARSANGFFGTAYDDKEITLGVPDAYQIRGIYEGTGGSTPLPPSATFSVSSGVFVNYEKVIGQTSNAHAVIISTGGTTYFYYVSGTLLNGENVVGQTSLAVALLSNVSAGSPNISSRYFFDNGQRDGFYDLAKLVRKVGAPAPSNPILVCFDYFTASGSGDFFDVESYSSIPYQDIPTYSPTRVDLGGLEPDGTYELSDAIDFRPVVGQILGTTTFGSNNTQDPTSPVDLSSTSSGAVFAPFGYSTGRNFESSRSGITSTAANAVDTPVSGSAFVGDISFYVGRIDKVFLHKSGIFQTSTGTPALSPTKPKAIDDAIELFELQFPAYTKNTKSVKVRSQDHRRFTMKDISRISNRVTNLERVTSLSMLEKDTQTKQILDGDGFDRFKSGFLVDNFRGHRVGDVNHPDYECAVDAKLGAARPQSYSQFFDITLNTNTSQNYAQTGDLVTLPYTPITYINSDKASRSINVNPYNVFSFFGNVKLTPGTDVWQDTTQLPEVRINREGSFDAITSAVGNSMGTVWNSWQTTWAGEPSVVSSEVQSTSNGSWAGDPTQGGEWVAGETVTREITETVETQTRTGVTTSVVEDFVETRNDRVVSVSLIPFIRARTIEIDGTNMKPNTNHYFYFDNMDVNKYVRPFSTDYSQDSGTTVASNLKTDGNGRLRGYFELPNDNTQRFPTGARELRVTSSYFNLSNPSSQGSAIYQAQGLLQASQTEVTSTRNGRVIRESANGERTIQNRGENLNTSPRDTQAPPFADPIPPVVDPVTQLPPPPPPTSPVVTIPTPPTFPIPIEVPDLFVFRREPIGFQARREPESRLERGHGDPLAQSFLVEAANGMMMTSLDLFFRTKDTTMPVSVEIRTMINGYPAQTVLPFSTVTKNPADVNTSEDGSAVTTFTFESPVYLSDKVEYAFVVYSNSNEYEAFIARMGEKDLATSQIITEQPCTGSLFMSQNASTWSAEQTDDLKFHMKIAQFDTSKTPVLKFENDALPVQILQENPIQTFSGQSYVQVSSYSHGMYSATSNVTIAGVTGDKQNCVVNIGTLTPATTPTNGTYTGIATSAGTGTGCTLDIIVTDGAVSSAVINTTGSGYLSTDTLTVATFGGTTGTVAVDTVADTLGGIPIASINATFTSLSNIGIDTFNVTPDISAFDLKTGYNADDSTVGGGDIATSTRDYYFDVLHTMIPNTQVEGCRISLFTNTTAMSSPEGYISGSVYNKRTTNNFLTLNDNSYLGYPSVVASQINETNEMSGAKSFNATLQLQSSNPNVSPVIDVGSIGCIGIMNRINNIDSSADVPTGVTYVASTESDGDNNVMTYMTRKVSLKNPASSLRVTADFFRPPTTDLKVLYKVLNNDESTPFDDLGWRYFNTDGSPNVTTEADARNFKEYEFSVEGLSEFSAFAVKIVGQGTNTSVVPMISALRCIALA